MKKQLVFTCIYIFISLTAVSQSYNYDSLGKRMRINTEQVILIIDKETDHPSRGILPTISLPNILTNFVNVGIDLAKIILTKNQEKYTATYSASTSESGLVFIKNPGKSTEPALNINSIVFCRIADKDTVTKVTLVPQINDGLFRFRIASLIVKYSKAKINKIRRQGNSIGLSISIKLDALWKEPNGSAPDLKKDSLKQANSLESEANIPFTIKTATLGESSVILPQISIGKKMNLYDNYYSNWFQMIPSGALKFATENSKWRTGWYTISITVKEANSNNLTSKIVSDFFNSSSSDIGSFLKQFLQTGNK